MWKKKIKLKEYFVLLLLLFSVVVTVIPSLVSADDPTIGPYVAPGAPDEISMEQLFKIGILDDMNHITGEHAWNGAMLAAREINEAGGLFINSTHYYLGLVAENTFEAEPELNISKAISAANTMIADYDPHIIMGGFSNDALIHYLEPIMDAKIPFICTGSSSDIFSQNVLDNYPRYKYFFRAMLNGSKIGGDIINYIPYLANILTGILGKEVTKVGILREDAEWTVAMANALNNFMPFFGLEVVEEIALPYDSSEQDLKNAWYQIDNSGAQIVVPITSSGLGTLIGRTYGEVRPNCIVCGINVQAQLGNYWDDTSGGGQYEITTQGTYRTEKTPKTIPFWDNYVSDYSMEPLFTAVCSYDAIYLLYNATSSTQSFNADQIVFGLEQINSTNTFTGVNGNIAFTSSHDLLGGPDYVAMLFCQWQEGGTKVVLPSGNILYPDSFATGSLVIPEWGQDESPPITTVSLSGIRGFEDSYITDVIINLLATDELSGVAITEYSFDNVNWITYEGPITITDEKFTIFYYRSIDYAGNVEYTKVIMIQIQSRHVNNRFLIYGTNTGPVDLDPHYAWDSASIDVIDQVVESLFVHNLSDPSLKSIPRLASAMGTWSDDNLNYTVMLRSGVTFHDGTPFDAAAVQWNFDRLAYFLNITGTLPEEEDITQLEELLRWPDGTPIINRTEIRDTYIIRFVLNKPYSPFKALLSSWATGILSPHSTPSDHHIDTNSGDLVGTGPFVYDYYNEGDEVRFHAFEDYWMGSAEIKNLVFTVIPDQNDRNNALLDGNIDFLKSPLTSMLDTFEEDPEITLINVGPSAIIQFLGMNNKQINRTMRKAISYAINYSNIIDDIMEGQAVRMKSPVPEGILYANESFNVATYNLTKAREYMISMGMGEEGWNDEYWQRMTFLTFNYTYNLGSPIREAIFPLLQNNLKQIGIQVTNAGMSWSEFLDRLNEREGFHRDMLQLFYLGWAPDYNDPSNFINPLFSNVSSSNFAQVNDPHLEDLMEQGLAETDPSSREAVYDKTQKYIVEDLMPWAFGYVPRNYDAYYSDLTGFQSNPMDRVWFYSVSRIPHWICNETAEWGVEAGDKLVWEASGYMLETAYMYLSQESPVQWMLDIDAINLTYWEDLPSKNVPCDFYSTIWATIYNRSITEGAPWEEWIPLSPLTFYNACEQLIYNQFMVISQNWHYLVIPVPVNLEILNNSLSELVFFGIENISSSIKDNSLQYVLDAGPGMGKLTLNYTYNNQGILTHLFLTNSPIILLDMKLIDTTSPEWIEIPTDQEVELGSRFFYNISAFDEYGIDHYWISDTENFEINSSGWIVDKDFLEVGVYEFEVRAYDPYDNYCTATIQVTVQDTTAPFYSPLYDTLPSETIIIYTRSVQVIGSLLVQDRSEIAFVVLQHNNPSGGPNGFVVETYPQQGAFGYYYNNIIVKTTSSLEIGRHELSLYMYDAYGNEVSKDFVVLVYRQFDLKLSGELDYLEKEDVRISISAYLTDAETGEYIDPSDYAGLNLVVGFDLYDNDGNLVKGGYLTYEGSGIWRWVDVDTIGDQKDLLTKGVYMVHGWVDVIHDYILKDRDVIQIHIDPPPDEVDPMAILTVISFSGLIALIAVQSIFYIRKRKRRS